MSRPSQSLVTRWISEEHEDVLVMDGFDSCIAGVVTRFGQDPIVCYDRAKVISTLMKRDGMSRDDALDFHSFNQAGAWVGDRTPCFLDLPPTRLR